MPTNAGILTFISRIITTSESFKVRKSVFFVSCVVREPLILGVCNQVRRKPTRKALQSS